LKTPDSRRSIKSGSKSIGRVNMVDKSVKGPNFFDGVRISGLCARCKGYVNERDVSEQNSPGYKLNECDINEIPSIRSESLNLESKSHKTFLTPRNGTTSSDVSALANAKSISPSTGKKKSRHL
jgi:hypothetical protein